MTLTLEPQDGPQYVTERATDAPVVPAYRESLADVLARHKATQARVHELSGVTCAERRRYRGRA